MLGLLAVVELALVAALVDDLDGGAWLTATLGCALIVALAVLVLLRARGNAAEDPPGARALVVLGTGLAFAGVAATALLLALASIG